MSLETYSWVFLAFYVAVMVWFGLIGKSRSTNADEYATARGGYGPIFLSLAFTSTAASGATFLGMPALAYHFGLSTMWFMFLYPIGLYLGVLLCQHAVAHAGQTFGSRSIPEYLGEKYQSELIRILTSVFSLVLMFYLASQLVSGLVMFETMLGLSLPAALAITTAVLAGYVVMGGAHADVFTDGVQGFLMVLLAAAILVMFLVGCGVDGGLSAVLKKIGEMDSRTLDAFNPANLVTATPWHAIAVVIFFIPIGLLPHVGNKLWALKDERQRKTFVWVSFFIGMLLSCMAFGGILGRAILGDELISTAANDVIPRLFIELFPTWLAAMLGVGILAAIMSTADGVVITMGQIFANDIYRLTYAPRFQADRTDEEIDRTALRIGRVATFAVLIASAGVAWLMQDLNINLLGALGIGGMSAAFSGPLILGILWRGVTKQGALAGFLAGATVFGSITTGLVQTMGTNGSVLYAVTSWLEGEAANSFSVGALGCIAGCVVTVVVSLFTPKMDDDHVARVHAA